MLLSNMLDRNFQLITMVEQIKCVGGQKGMKFTFFVDSHFPTICYNVLTQVAFQMDACMELAGGDSLS